LPRGLGGPPGAHRRSGVRHVGGRRPGQLLPGGRRHRRRSERQQRLRRTREVSVATVHPRPPGRRSSHRPDDGGGPSRSGADTFRVPALGLIGLFLSCPALGTISLGMTDYRLTGLAAADPQFIGLENYRQVLADAEFWRSLRLTLIFVLGSGVLGQTLLGFCVAWSLRRLPRLAKGLIETLVLAAWVVPTSVGSFLWLALLDRRE